MLKRIRLGRLLIAAVLVTPLINLTAGSIAGVYDDPAVKPAPPVEAKPFSYLAPEVLDAMKRQEPLKRAAERLQQDLVKLPGGVKHPIGHGFAGVALLEDRVRLWWKGALPESVRSAVEEARVHAPVEVAKARYSSAELQAQAEGLKKEMYADPDGPVHMVGVASDGSGLFAAVENAAAADELEVLYPAISKLTVPLELKRRPRVTVAGRLNDTNPYYGGARIRDRDSHCDSSTGQCGIRISCTAGFPVRSTGGGYYLVTASHCGYSGQVWQNGNGSSTIGSAVLERTDHDLLLVAMPGPITSSSNVIWDGGVPGGANTAAEFTKPIAGWGHVTPGEWLCTSGSFSGAVCLWQVQSNFPVSYCARDSWGTYECMGDMFAADQVNGVRGCRAGDSGGPVFGLNADSTRVIAKGIMSGCDEQNGGDYVVFQDWYTVVNDFGVNVIN
ncbi:hypothetical protein Skr01_73350 [Sphaerisporangium krabiense]|uniref:Peptidase S1 domain-containing protein n=1 Tax=Sphaerisporangium krabiense TaxID=763782 RepID=A0A7W8Z8S6_9ACTN|nr:trypsin-like serine protease [Sphaerisporangium krabiense]MBB5629592.1 hypothetical protein [Sphaerisporangium krabiense]GII67250.1 hypothetical protein Skr01_73350 [Sphaerisporangium krabiense]